MKEEDQQWQRSNSMTCVEWLRLSVPNFKISLLTRFRKGLLSLMSRCSKTQKTQPSKIQVPHSPLPKINPIRKKIWMDHKKHERLCHLIRKRTPRLLGHKMLYNQRIHWNNEDLTHPSSGEVRQQSQCCSPHESSYLDKKIRKGLWGRTPSRVWKVHWLCYVGKR